MHRIDHIKIFAPTIKYELLRIFLAIATILKIIIIQIDVIRVYLKTVFNQNKPLIYINIPQRYLTS